MEVERFRPNPEPEPQANRSSETSSYKVNARKKKGRKAAPLTIKVDNEYNPLDKSSQKGKKKSAGRTYTRADETQFLIDNPDFDEMPASIEEFLGPGYLDIDWRQNPEMKPDTGIRDGVKAALIEIFGPEIDPKNISLARTALFTGGIGIGKSTLAAIALLYCVHWVQCLNEPQLYFGLTKGSRIAFMLMSTRDSQAKEVLFSDIKGYAENSQWFKDHCRADPKRTNQLRYPKNIWIIPGNSRETAFEGYNILCGVIDEGDSHTVTEEKDYAEDGYDTIYSRIESRYPDYENGSHRGLLMVIGQMKKAEGFMARKKRELEKRKAERGDAAVFQMTIWESLGWERYRDKKTGKIDVFYYDRTRRKVVPPAAALAVASDNIIKIPTAFLTAFESNPVKALRDLAGIPPAVEDPFIALTDRIDDAMDAYEARMPDLLYPVGSSPNRPQFADNFYATDKLKRAVHVDIGYAAHGDALGMAMGHIPEMVEVDGELQPFIMFDMLLRIKPSGGQKLMLADFRKIIYELRDERGFNIAVVTFDGFQSQDSIQIMKKKRFNTAEVSVDRNKGPYEDLRQAIYERRIGFPRYKTYKNKDDHEKTLIAKKELMELTDTGKKIDHPPKNGSKDLTDAMAGVTWALMGNGSFRRGARGGRGSVNMTMDSELDIESILNGSTAETLDDRELAKVLAGDYGDRMEQNHVGLMVPSPGYGLPAIEKNPYGLLPGPGD